MLSNQTSILAGIDSRIGSILKYHIESSTTALTCQDLPLASTQQTDANTPINTIKILEIENTESRPNLQCFVCPKEEKGKQ